MSMKSIATEHKITKQEILILKSFELGQTTASNYYCSEVAQIACLSFEGELVGVWTTTMSTLIDARMIREPNERVQLGLIITSVWCRRRTLNIEVTSESQRPDSLHDD